MPFDYEKGYFIMNAISTLAAGTLTVYALMHFYSKNKEEKETTGELEDSPNVRWEDVAGLPIAKAFLKDTIILPLKFPNMFTGNRQPCKRILLYGPPGCGKSILAKSIATEISSSFFSISPSDILSKWFGTSEKKIKVLFDKAREKKNAVIFIDEIDSLGSSRSGHTSEHSRSILAELLIQMDGVGKNSDGILIVAATNTPWDLDMAVRRRFEKRIYIGLPDLDGRKNMFRIHMGSHGSSLSDDDYNILALATEGYSGSDIQFVCKDAIMKPIRSLNNATHFKEHKDKENGREGLIPCLPNDPQGKPMTLSDIHPDQLIVPNVSLKDCCDSLVDIKPSLNSIDLESYDQFTKEHGSYS
ncbi:hypothetical protein CYY_004496 [Polysphondylium violaceum]|uniref:AAA+ ATPase domain-containing protein n=1 Tax=Polysphondylium violaceum TaxID=133409 RepID=A0A8J4PVB9_9MYCE|nr:hypothetical protein CYY_004496 [Polysphondylium violaceum]